MNALNLAAALAGALAASVLALAAMFGALWRVASAWNKLTSAVDRLAQAFQDHLADHAKEHAR